MYCEKRFAHMCLTHMPWEINTSFYYFKYDIPHSSDNLATLGAVYKQRVIQLNRLSQVLAHRDKFRSFRTEAPAIVLKIVLYQCHT